jgi:YD repeat-containing protein
MKHAHEYNANGNLTKITYANGAFVAYTHYACGQIHTETANTSGGHTVTTTYTYDDNARPATMTVTSSDPADAAPKNPGAGSFVKYTTYDADGFLPAELCRAEFWSYALPN